MTPRLRIAAGLSALLAARLQPPKLSGSIVGSEDATVWARKALSVGIVGSGRVKQPGNSPPV